MSELTNEEYQQGICKKKRKYSSKKNAKDKAKSYKKIRGKGLKRQYVYKCRFCDGWHLTKQKQTIASAILHTPAST